MERTLPLIRDYSPDEKKMNFSQSNSFSPDEIPADIAVVSGDMIIFSDDFSIGQCAMTLLLLAGATACALYVHNAEFLAPGIKYAAWIALLALGLGMFIGPLWRRQITIDLGRREVIIDSGPLVPFSTKHVGLNEFEEFKVRTDRIRHTIHHKDLPSENVNIVGQTYLLMGRSKLVLLKRSFDATDKEAERIGQVIETRLRSVLSGHLGKNN